MKLHCKRCDNKKPEEEFWHKKSCPHRNFRAYTCAMCQSAMKKKRYPSNRTKILKAAALYRSKNRRLLVIRAGEYARRNEKSVKRRKGLYYQRNREGFLRRAAENYRANKARRLLVTRRLYIAKRMYPQFLSLSGLAMEGVRMSKEKLYILNKTAHPKRKNPAVKNNP